MKHVNCIVTLLILREVINADYTVKKGKLIATANLLPKSLIILSRSSFAVRIPF